jgi:hypothetical protein
MALIRPTVLIMGGYQWLLFTNDGPTTEKRIAIATLVEIPGPRGRADRSVGWLCFILLYSELSVTI